MGNDLLDSTDAMGNWMKRYLPQALRQSVGPLLLLIAALSVYGTRYWEPASLFWDENYHVASAQKEIDGVLYMETHPPLGKMLIGLGEVLVGANRGLDTSQLLTRDHINNANLPAGYHYAGVRLASVASMVLAVLLLYGILRRLLRNRFAATAFASLLVFDNALVVHNRSAMLEGIQIAFVLLVLHAFVRIVDSGRPIRLRHYATLGALIGLTAAVKLNAAVLLLLFVGLFGVDQWQALRERRWLAILHRFMTSVPVAVIAVGIAFAAVFYVHIARVETIAGNRVYKASADYQQHIRNGTTWTPSGFAIGFRDHLRNILEYSDGVPRLDVCKPGENGSHASGWPLGKKSINYRWNKVTIDGQVRVSYTYLLANPLVWLPVLLGIVLSLGLAISRFVYGNPVRDERLFRWIMLTTSLYVGYMVAILQVDRVMYLYHYLLPLVFGVVNLALVHAYLFADGLRERRLHTLANLVAFVVIVAATFAFFAPLTYGIPITTEQFELRQWFGLWKLEPVR